MKPHSNNGGLPDTNITTLEIMKYRQDNNDLTLISNLNGLEINNNLRTYFYEQNNNNWEIPKEGILNLLGKSLKENLNDIYDNQFLLSISDLKDYEDKIILIIKLNEKALNNEFIANQLENINTLFEIKEPSYFNYLTITEDKFLILSSNKQLILNAIKSSQNKSSNDHRKVLEEKLQNQFKSEKLLLISNNHILDKIQSDNTKVTEQKLITTFSSSNHIVKLKTGTINNNKNTNISELNILNNQNRNISLIYSDQTESYLRNFSFIELNDNQKKLNAELAEISNLEKLFLKSNEDWLISIPIKGENNINIKNLEFLKDYEYENLKVNNLDYKIWYKNSLENIDNNVIFKEKYKLFSCETDDFIIISNSISELNKGLNIKEESINYLNKDALNKMRKPLLNDMFFITEINKDQFQKNYKIINDINLLTGKYIKFSIQSIKAIVNQQIPEIYPDIYLETNIKIY
tara:strand:+ start:1607 stop:2995 length:1389 start_codon:yes stop_codon:yes gene_type:complete